MSEKTLDEKIKALSDLINDDPLPDAISQWDYEFIENISIHKEKGRSLSPKQLAQVERLYEELIASPS